MTQQKTVNADGSYDIHYYTGGTFQGTAYASYDNAYTGGVRGLETFYDGDGNRTHVCSLGSFAGIPSHF